MPEDVSVDTASTIETYAYSQQVVTSTAIDLKNRRTRAEKRRERKKRDILSPGGVL